MSERPAVYGLLLAGGMSRRMGSDKAALCWDGEPQLDRAYRLLAQHCSKVFLSVRGEQRAEPLRAKYAQIIDREGDVGPAAGILAALTKYPQVAWLVLACDLPLVDGQTMKSLLAQRRPEQVATAFRSRQDGLPEPLCAIWEPRSRAVLETAFEQGLHCPRKVLIRSGAALLDPPVPHALDNMNRPEDLAALRTCRRGAGSEPA